MTLARDTTWLTVWLAQLDLHKVVAPCFHQLAHASALIDLSQQDLNAALKASYLGGLSDALWAGILELRERAAASETTSKLSISGCCNGKQRCHMSLLDTMIGEFESSGAPVRCLGRLQNLRMEASRASSHWFDVPHNFQLATQRALDAQEETFKALQGALAWAAESSASSVASRMRACAELCARAEQHDGAAALLHLAILRDPVEGSSRSPISKLTARIDAAQAWRLEVASPLLSAGAVQPWPPVLAVLARDGGADVARAMALLAAPFMRAADAMDNGALYESRPGGIDALLREASAHGCEALVEQLLELECSALEVDENGSTPLHMAASAGHIGTCKLLMSADANPLVVNSLGLSALELAINGGHSALQRVLSPTVADFEMNGQLATTLPAFQPDANGRTTGITTLMLFVHANDMRATSLLDVGDPADFLPSSAAPALFGWMQTGLKAIGSGLKEIGSGQEQNTNDDSQQLVNVLSPRGCTALTIAAEAGALSMVAALLTARADPNLGRPPPLSCACLFNHVEVATRLLAAKASPDAHFPNLPGWPANVEDRSPEQGKASSCEESLLAFMPCSALGIAASIGSATIAEVLLSAGATADLRMLSERPQRSESTKHHVQPVSIPGPTALSIAAAHGHAMVAKVLLKHGADANFASRPTLQAGTDTLQFEPPLITAAQLGHEGVCRVLLQHGARIDIATDDQKTALHVASAEGHVCVVRTCLEFGAALDLILPQPSASTILSPLQAAAAFGHADVCTALVHARAFVDFHQGSTYTPLRLACRNDHEEVARVLIQMRADLEATSSGGTARRAAPRPTALGEAVKMCHTNLVRLLLDAGADPRGGSGNYGAGGSANYGSALICCMRESLTRLRSDAAQGGDASVRHLETVKLLLRHRASLDDVDERGLTALHHACKNGLDDCVDLLITARAGLDVVNCDGNTVCAHRNGHSTSQTHAHT